MLRPQDCAGRKSGQCWDPASHEYIAFGHEVSATAVQLARAVAVFANGGLLVQPHLVKSKERPKVNGGVETIPIALAQPARVIPPELAFTIRKILQKVVKEGTGKQAAIPGYSSGGKTGTAEIFEHGHWSKSLHNSSFIGFAPVTNPRVVVVVTMNRTPKQGASASAPVFRHIALTALQVMNVPKDEPETDVRPSPPTRQEEMAPAADTLRASERPLAPEPPARPESSGPDLEGPRMPDFSGKSVLAVMHEAARLGIEVAIVGNGLAKVQHPPAGTILPRDGKVSVEFAVLR
jgi:membrane peptidoglycan carboxypeptidase